MSPLLVLLGVIGMSSATSAGPAVARDSGRGLPLVAAVDPTLRPRTERQPAAAFRARRPGKRYSVTVPIGKPKPSVALPRIEGPADGRLPLVVIDAGHGGHEPGAGSPP